MNSPNLSATSIRSPSLALAARASSSLTGDDVAMPTPSRRLSELLEAAAADAAAAAAKAKAWEMAKRATSLVASLFATKSASPEDAEPENPEEKKKQESFLFASFPTTNVAL